MLRLDLTAEPRWLHLGHDVQFRVAPPTTALMAASRSDPAVETAPESASDEEHALVVANAIARRAVTEGEGVGNAPVTPEGIDVLLEVWPIFEAFQAVYVSKGLLPDAWRAPCSPRAASRSTDDRAYRVPGAGRRVDPSERLVLRRVAPVNDLLMF